MATEKKNEIVVKFQELINNGPIESIISEAETLMNDFHKIVEEQEAYLLNEFKSSGGDPIMFEYEQDQEDHKFKELTNLFNDRKSKYKKQKIESDNQRLKEKKQIIDDIKKIIEEEEQIGKAFQQFNELKEKWRSLGPIQSKHFKTLQTEYGKLLELFYYNIKIYKELKEHDLKRNADLKKELIEKTSLLLFIEPVKEAESLIKTYQHEWDEIGPATKEQHEILRPQFRTLINQIYKRIRENYTVLKGQQADNLKQKQALVEKIKTIEVEKLNNHKKWHDALEMVVSVQEEWKKIGFAGKEGNQSVWKSFRESSNLFFKAKRDFYKQQKIASGSIKDKKNELITEAQKLCDHQNHWKENTDKIIRLQGQWKDLGSVNHKEEEVLWKKFRAICDTFFNAKKGHFAAQDAEQVENLKKKEELVIRIEQAQLTGNVATDKEMMKAFSEEWNNISFVPIKSKRDIEKKYNSVVEEKYQKMNLPADEKESIRFKNKIEHLKHADGSGELLEKERRTISDKIKKIEAEVNQYENNMSFISGSKGNVLKLGIEAKLDGLKGEVKKLKDQLKMLSSRNEFKKVQQ